MLLSLRPAQIGPQLGCCLHVLAAYSASSMLVMHLQIVEPTLLALLKHLSLISWKLENIVLSKLNGLLLALVQDSMTTTC